MPPAEVDDLVQSTLADALAAAHAPDTPSGLRPWIYGIAKNKIADYLRKSRREVPHEPATYEDVAAEVPPASAEDLLRWAEKELPDGDDPKKTLEWMLREGSGETLESIAQDANVPAPRVRQRVARMRRHYRARRAALLAAATLFVAVVVVLTVLLAKSASLRVAPLHEIPTVNLQVPEPPKPDPRKLAEDLRRGALRACDAAEWQRCLDGLDEAKALDPAGDTAPTVQAARLRATDAMKAPSRDPLPDIAPQPSGARAAPSAAWKDQPAGIPGYRGLPAVTKVDGGPSVAPPRSTSERFLDSK